MDVPLAVKYLHQITAPHCHPEAWDDSQAWKALSFPG